LLLLLFVDCLPRGQASSQAASASRLAKKMSFNAHF